MDEEMLLKKHDKYISHLARSYLFRCNQPDWLFDDLKSEASLALISASRKWGFDALDLSPYQFRLAHNAIRAAMRRCVWRANDEKNPNRSFERKYVTFSDVTASDPEFDDSKLDFLLTEDDYSDFEVKDLLDRLPDVERETLNLLLRGYSKAEIAKIRKTDKSNVSHTIDRLKNKLKDIA